MTINTDDPAVHHTTINHDYDVAVTRWGYELDDLLRCEKNAVAAAFLADDHKPAILERIEKGYEKARNQGIP